jgi:hypothetical protein
MTRKWGNSADSGAASGPPLVGEAPEGSLARAETLGAPFRRKSWKPGCAVTADGFQIRDGRPTPHRFKPTADERNALDYEPLA